MNIFKQFFKSIYSPKEVALFRFQGIGKTIGYVFLLMLICTLITGISLGIDFFKWVSATNEKIVNELPDFELKNGILTSELDTPLIQESNGFTLIFDSTGQITASDVSKHKNAIGLLQKEAVLVNESQSQHLPYSSFGELSVNKETIVGFANQLDTIGVVILPILYLFIYLFQTSLKFIGISVLALIGLLLNAQMKRNLRYNSLWILSAYAVTIPTLFFSITNALKIYIPFAFLLYWATAAIVLYLIIVEIPKSKAQLKEPEQPE